MATFGVKTDITFSTDKAREQFSNMYKAFSSDSINMKKPLTINAGEIETLDLSESSFILLHANTYGLENEVLNITLHNTTDDLEITNISFLFMDCFNITSIDIENTSNENNVEIIAVY